MSQQPPAITDYGFLSDCRSGALVSRCGSVDWWCPSRFDRPSVFGRLLDPGAGHWSLAPVGAGDAGHRTERAYVPGSLVLRTVHHTDAGSVSVTDALAAEPGARGHELGMRSPGVLLRVVEGLSGRVRMRSDFLPRPEYGLITPYLREDREGVVAAGGGQTLRLRGPVPLRPDRDRVCTEFEVSAGQVVGFDLAFAPAYGGPPARLDPVPALADTVAAWEGFRESHEYDGRYPDVVRHSAVVLQGLTYGPSGAVAAAATTSLPELLGGDRNYDYRYAWLRDFALTLNALWVAACPDEVSRLFDWVSRSIGRIGAAPVPVMFGLEGERDISEHDMLHLHGYAGSRPVRIGNDAWRQRQLDIPGEVLSAAWRFRDYLGERFETELCDLLIGLTEQVAATWRLPDRGMWETRDRDRHYLSSKVLCWAAMDRAVQLAPRLGERADPHRWARIRDEIRATVLEQGWNEQVGAFTGAFGSDRLDASALYLPIVHFLPATDPRMRATIEVIERELCDPGGLVRRWSTDPAGFVLCSFWLVECLVMAGEYDRGRALFEKVIGRANDVGLFAEQIDPSTGAHQGNMPQALSHIGLINAAWRLTEPGAE